MAEIQNCDEYIHFGKPSYEDWFDRDYHMWTEIFCGLGHEIDDTSLGFIPLDSPWEHYEEKIYDWWIIIVKLFVLLWELR